MLASKYRLRASADIAHVIRNGKKIHTPCAVITILIPSPVNHTRIACVVGKKVDRSSVVRHSVQRKLRAGAAALPLEGTTPYDMVIVASNTRARTMKNEEITNHIRYAIQTAITHAN